MKQELQKVSPRFNKKKRVSNLLFLPILIIIVIGILFFLTSKEPNIFTSPQEADKKLHSIWESISRTFSEHLNKGKQPADRQSEPGIAQGRDPNSIIAGDQAPSLKKTGEIQTQPAEYSALPETGSVQQAAEAVNSFFSHLDTRPYIQSFHLEKPSKVYFTDLIRDLLNNPPVISRETDDLATVLKNTAHFYRVIGKDNITLLKTLLDQEKPYIENVFANSYTLSECPSCLHDTLSLQISADSLYNYAGFFLNTMGGRLYLFRRDPVSRMTVSYYGILIIDKANRESNNRNGIQIKQAIDSLIAEIENSGEQLRLKERYLDKLYELKAKYQ